MHLEKRIKLLAELGSYMLSDDGAWVSIKEKAERENTWFTKEFIDKAVENIATSFLNAYLLDNWTKEYQVKDTLLNKKNIGIVMAGNIPLVGFHDFLCAFVSGHQQTIKPSSKDSILVRHIIEELIEWEPEAKEMIFFADNLKGCDAYLATGSNNSSRYFDYYFSKYPTIIRRNRTSVAILDGKETEQDLEKLSDDIQMYFGLGCRNVTKLYVPFGYDFLPLLNALRKYEYYFEFHKYKHNFDYQLAIQIMGGKYYMTNNSMLLVEEKNVFSPVSQVNYEFYEDKAALYESLKENDSVQCLVGNGLLDFGETQKPKLHDYADGVDTMLFLMSLDK